MRRHRPVGAELQHVGQRSGGDTAWPADSPLVSLHGHPGQVDARARHRLLDERHRRRERRGAAGLHRRLPGQPLGEGVVAVVEGQRERVADRRRAAPCRARPRPPAAALARSLGLSVAVTPGPSVPPTNAAADGGLGVAGSRACQGGARWPARPSIETPRCSRRRRRPATTRAPSGARRRSVVSRRRLTVDVPPPAGRWRPGRRGRPDRRAPRPPWACPRPGASMVSPPATRTMLAGRGALDDLGRQRRSAGRAWRTTAARSAAWRWRRAMRGASGSPSSSCWPVNASRTTKPRRRPEGRVGQRAPSTAASAAASGIGAPAGAGQGLLGAASTAGTVTPRRPCAARRDPGGRGAASGRRHGRSVRMPGTMS